MKNFKKRFISFVIIGLVSLSLLGLTRILATPEDYPTQPDQTVSINNDALGWHGPLSLDATYSDQLGFIANGKFTLTLTPLDAIMIEGALGAKEYRYAFTWGHQLNETQRFKLTAEHLAQKIRYDFDSGGIDQWTGQNAFGGAYQVLIPSRWLKTVDFNAYYAKANSKDLESIIFANDMKTNFRHIAGATSEGGSGGVSIQPWRNGLIKAAINYDKVKYNTRYQAGPNEQGVGETISFEQLLTKQLKFKFEQSHRKIYDNYEAGIDWLAPISHGNRLELGLHANHIQSRTALGNENRIGLKIAYSWGEEEAANAKYVAPTVDLVGDITQWTTEPAVHMEQVLTVADQKTIDNVKPLEMKPVAQALQAQVITVQPGEHVNIPVGEYKATQAQLKPLGLAYNQATHTIEGTVPKTIAAKDYPVKLEKTSAMPLSNTMLRLKPATSASETVIFRVTNSPYAPKVKGAIPDFYQSFSNPNIDINLNKDDYFTNPLSPDVQMKLSVSGLPTNLKATPVDDVNKISGTATVDNAIHGPYTITVTANNDPNGNHDPAYSTSQTFQLLIEATVPIYNGPTDLPQGTVTKPYSYNLAGDFAGNNLTITVTGLENSGLEYKDGLIQGTPTAANTYTLLVKAKNNYGELDKTLTLTILPAPAYHGPKCPDGQNYCLPDAEYNQPYSYNFKSQFTPDGITINVENSTLPNGLQYDKGTGIISGTPTQSIDSKKIGVNASYGGVTIYPVIYISVKSKPSYHGPTSLPDGVTGDQYDIDFASYFTGTNLTIDVSNLPKGLQYFTSGQYKGHIEGVPTEPVTNQKITAKASNTQGEITVYPTLTIYQKPAYTGNGTLPEGAIGHDYPQYNLKGDYTPSKATVSVESASLPPFLTYNQSTGYLTATSQPTEAKTYTLITHATNGPASIKQNINLTVGTPPSYHGDDPLPYAVLGDSYSYPLKSKFNPSTATVTIQNEGDLTSHGLQYTNGIIQGTPTKADQLTLQVEAESADVKLDKSLNLDIKTPPSLNGLLLPEAFEGSPYGPVNLSTLFDPTNTKIIAVTDLPPGLSNNNGEISGTPTKQNDYTITVTAESPDGVQKAGFKISLDVGPPPIPPKYNGNGTITSGKLWTSYAGYDLAKDFTPEGTTVVIESGLEGSGLTSKDGQINPGTPTHAKTYQLKVKATHDGISIEPTITLVIAPAIGKIVCMQIYDPKKAHYICDSVYTNKCFPTKPDTRHGWPIQSAPFQGTEVDSSRVRCVYNNRPMPGPGYVQTKDPLKNSDGTPIVKDGTCNSKNASSCPITTTYTN